MREDGAIGEYRDILGMDSSVRLEICEKRKWRIATSMSSQARKMPSLRHGYHHESKICTPLQANAISKDSRQSHIAV